MSITNEKVTEYLDSFYKPLTEGLAVLRAEAEEDRVPIIKKSTEELILSILRIYKPSNLLEIGTAVGYSSSCFAECVPELEITTIEYNADTSDTAKKNIERLGYSDRINVLTGDARDVLRTIPDTKFDIVFIDAAKGQYLAFWKEAERFFKKGTCIISDNVLMRGSTASDEYDPTGRFKTAIRRMREYLDYISSLDYVKTSVLSTGDGIAVSTVTSEYF